MNHLDFQTTDLDVGPNSPEFVDVISRNKTRMDAQNNFNLLCIHGFCSAGRFDKHDVAVCWKIVVPAVVAPNGPPMSRQKLRKQLFHSCLVDDLHPIGSRRYPAFWPENKCGGLPRWPGGSIEVLCFQRASNGREYKEVTFLENLGLDKLYSS